MIHLSPWCESFLFSVREIICLCLRKNRNVSSCFVVEFHPFLFEPPPRQKTSYFAPLIFTLFEIDNNFYTKYPNPLSFHFAPPSILKGFKFALSRQRQRETQFERNKILTHIRRKSPFAYGSPLIIMKNFDMSLDVIIHSVLVTVNWCRKTNHRCRNKQ